MKFRYKMKTFIKIIITLLVIVLIGGAVAWFGFLKPEPLPISTQDRANLTILPLPTELELGDDYFELDTGLNYSFVDVSTERLEKKLKRFHSRLEAITGQNIKKNGTKNLILDCKQKNGTHPTLEDDESYKLIITEEQIKLSANSEAGIGHGLETLTQLLKNIDGKWMIQEAIIKDSPRFPWRGLMIDVARHWITKETLLKNLDAMAAVKMNVLHLHLTDYQGFRIESKTFPKLHEKGSDGDFYSQEDIREIIHYANERGIRIVPEFDIPGHTTAWFVGHPELASAPGPYELDSIFGILDPVMDPTRDEVYEFLDVFIEEMAMLFPDEYLHIGGDEVKAKHWEENPSIQKFMKTNQLKDAHELQAYFNKRIQKIVAKHGKQMMGWDEILHPELPKDGIAVQSWRSHKSLWDAARSGNKAVLSSGYYLDHKRPASFHYNVDPLQIDGGVSIEIDTTNWRSYECKMLVQDTNIDGFLYLFGKGKKLRGVMKFMGEATDFSEAKTEGNKISFEVDASVGNIGFDAEIKKDSIIGEASIAMFTIDLRGKQVGGSDMPEGVDLPSFEKIKPLTTEQKQNILGGEACQWSEMVDNNTINSRIWPRAAAVAEKLWSPKELTKDTEDMYRRLMVLDKALEAMGVGHQSSGKRLVSEIAPPTFEKPLQTLVDVLQEDEFFNRMKIYDPMLYTTTPLNRVVDAAPAESYSGYRFNKNVRDWLATNDNTLKTSIINQLETWHENHKVLLPLFNPSEVLLKNDSHHDLPTDNSKLKEVEKHSENLSQLSKLALDKLKTSSAGRSIETDSLISIAKASHGGTILSVTEGLENLLRN